MPFLGLGPVLHLLHALFKIPEGLTDHCVGYVVPAQPDGRVQELPGTWQSGVEELLAEEEEAIDALELIALEEPADADDEMGAELEKALEKNAEEGEEESEPAALLAEEELAEGAELAAPEDADEEALDPAEALALDIEERFAASAQGTEERSSLYIEMVIVGKS
ncbi:hypothetical protein HY285_02835 [Candidatus Peregrinibacteria bacterium]|nr:hypothetical protein [Candidatus Peregrinibacteria bacterium]